MNTYVSRTNDQGINKNCEGYPPPPPNTGLILPTPLCVAHTSRLYGMQYLKRYSSCSQLLMIILFRIVTASDTFQVTLSHTAALPQCLATPQGLLHCNLMSKAVSTQSHHVLDRTSTSWRRTYVSRCCAVLKANLSTH